MSRANRIRRFADQDLPDIAEKAVADIRGTLLQAVAVAPLEPTEADRGTPLDIGPPLTAALRAAYFAGYDRATLEGGLR